MFEKKPKFIIVLLREQYGTLIVERKIVLNNLPNKLFRFREMQFPIDTTKPTYQKGSEVYYFLTNKGQQLNFNQIESAIDIKSLDLIVGQKIITELTKGVLDNKKDKILLIIFGAILGALLSAVICLAIFQNKVSELYASFIENSTTPVLPF